MSYCVVRCWCCTTPCTTLYDASYIPDASGPDALYDTVRRVVRSRRVGPRRLVRRPDASYNAFPTALAPRSVTTVDGDPSHTAHLVMAMNELQTTHKVIGQLHKQSAISSVT